MQFSGGAENVHMVLMLDSNLLFLVSFTLLELQLLEHRAHNENTYLINKSNSPHSADKLKRFPHFLIREWDSKL